MTDSPSAASAKYTSLCLACMSGESRSIPSNICVCHVQYTLLCGRVGELNRDTIRIFQLDALHHGSIINVSMHLLYRKSSLLPMSDAVGDVKDERFFP